MSGFRRSGHIYSFGFWCSLTENTYLYCPYYTVLLYCMSNYLPFLCSQVQIPTNDVDNWSSLFYEETEFDLE